MYFKSITLKNFMSYRDETIPFDNKGLILLEGKNMDEGDSNGSGKTSIFDGISWTLFGQTSRGLKGDSVVNRKIGSNCQVSLEIEYRGNNYLICRHRAHKDFKNDLFILKNGEEKIQLGTTPLTQDWILNNFNIDQSLFNCSVIFAQEDNFNFVDSTNKVQKEILSRVMKIDFDSMLLKAKEKSKKIGEIISDINLNVKVLEGKIFDVEEYYKNEIDRWNEEKKNKKKKIEEMIREDADSLNKYKDQIEFVDYSLIDEEVENLDKLTELKNRIISKIKVLELERTRIEGLVSKGECPTCGSDCSDLHVPNNTVIINRLENKLDALIDLSEKSQLKIKKLKDIDINNSKIEAECHSLKNMIKRNKASLKEVVESENPFLKKIEEEIENQNNYKNKIEELNKEIEDRRKEIPYIDFWKEAFGDMGIKSFIFDLICSSLTSRANHYVGVLSGGAVSIEFDTQKKLKSGEVREKFDVLISKESQKTDYKSYSGGEKRRISLAVDMALSDISCEYNQTGINIVVFDEQTNYMDGEGRRHFLNLLKDVSKTKQVFVVDHDSEFKSNFDNVWTITKEKGISTIERI